MLKSLNSMDFTVAVASNSMTIEQDMTFIKAALLYSDTITLVSPVASTYIELTDNANKKNEKASKIHTHTKLLSLLPCAFLRNSSVSL